MRDKDDGVWDFRSFLDPACNHTSGMIYKEKEKLTVSESTPLSIVSLAGGGVTFTTSEALSEFVSAI